MSRPGQDVGRAGGALGKWGLGKGMAGVQRAMKK